MKSQSNYRVKRYYTYLIVTIIALALPFIKIGGNQIFLLSFDKKELHLLGTAFDMQELYVMPFLLMLLFLGIFAITAIGGRAWCAWACPQTIFRVIYRDLIESKLLGLNRIKNKQKKIDYKNSQNLSKKVTGIFIWAILSLLAASNFMWYFIPPEDFFEYLKDPVEHSFLFGIVLSIALFLIYDIVSIKENFCVYVCPYSRVQSVLYDDNTLQTIYSTKRGGDIYDEKREKTIFKQKDLNENDECTACEACVKVCPTHIDIRKGTQLECINCLECVDACEEVMGKLDKESLVQWTSTNKIVHNTPTKVVRKSTIMYGVILIIVLGLLLVMSGKKENMLLDVNKTTQLYKIKENREVSNNYLLLFQNTDSKKHKYALEIIGNSNIKIKRFKPFSLASKKIARKVLILTTSEKLSSNDLKDTPIKIKLKAYAIDDPKNVVIYRDIVFLYPKLSEFK